MEALAILDELRAEDAEFEGDARMVFGREPYEIDPSSPLPDALIRAASLSDAPPRRVGMTFWTDAAILGAAGIPTVLFGPAARAFTAPRNTC